MGNKQGIRWDRAIAEGLRAATANLLPGSLLLFCGVVLVVCYYQIDSVRESLRWVEDLKARMGLLLPLISTAIFGGLLPLAFRRVFLKKGFTRGEFWFQILFWAEKGVEVDLLYTFQAYIFGNAANWQTVLPKVFVDQFIYVPLVAVPTMTLGYLWKNCHFSIAETRAALKWKGYWERSLPLLISNWAVWIPAAAIIYCFPLPLQLPLMNITLSFWVMLVMLLSADGEQ